MGNMDPWDMALLAVAGYVAVLSLTRLMIRRRDQLVEEFRKQVNKERSRRKREERKKQQQETVA